MKKLLLFFIYITATGVFGIYGQTTNDDMITLLRVSGSDKRADQITDAFIPQIQQLVPGIPDEVWVPPAPVRGGGPEQ
jgi:hypothetical protein